MRLDASILKLGSLAVDTVTDGMRALSSHVTDLGKASVGSTSRTFSVTGDLFATGVSRAGMTEKSAVATHEFEAHRIIGSGRVAEIGEPRISGGIPPHRPDGFLENGIHLATWDQITGRFATTPHREQLANGMLHALHDLKQNGYDEVFLGGSYVTTKIRPGDFDLTYADPHHLRRANLYQDLPIMQNRTSMKDVYGGEALPNLDEFFQQNDRVGKRVGIVQVDMSSLPPRPTAESPAIKAVTGNNPTQFGFLADQNMLLRDWQPFMLRDEFGSGSFSRLFDESYETFDEIMFRNKFLDRLELRGNGKIGTETTAKNFAQHSFELDQRRANWAVIAHGPIADPLAFKSFDPIVAAVEGAIVKPKPVTNMPTMMQLLERPHGMGQVTLPYKFKEAMRFDDLAQQLKRITEPSVPPPHMMPAHIRSPQTNSRALRVLPERTAFH